MEYQEAAYTHKHNIPDDYYGKNRPEMLEFIPNGANKILDVGCSKGYFGLLVKKEKGCTVWGIEPDKVSAENAALFLDKVTVGSFDDALPQLEDEKFDCLVFNDVLEHLAYPQNTLDKCKKLLKPNGYIIGSIPNIRFYYALMRLIKEKDWRYEDEGVMDKTHLRFFTKSTIIRMFEESGYKIIKIKGINQQDDKNFGKLYKLVKFIKPSLVDDVSFLQYGFIAQLN